VLLVNRTNNRGLGGCTLRVLGQLITLKDGAGIVPGIVGLNNRRLELTSTPEGFSISLIFPGSGILNRVMPTRKKHMSYPNMKMSVQDPFVHFMSGKS